MRKYKVWKTVDCVVGGLYLKPGTTNTIEYLLLGLCRGRARRWSGRERVVIPVKSKYVVEVSADHIEAGSFRHGSRLLRWREDKRPEACRREQIERVRVRKSAHGLVDGGGCSPPLS